MLSGGGGVALGMEAVTRQPAVAERRRARSKSGQPDPAAVFKAAGERPNKKNIYLKVKNS